MQLCGEILKSSNGITIAVNNASVTIERAEVANIEVHSQCPDKWMLSGSEIRHANVVQQYAKFVSRREHGMFAAQGKIQRVVISRDGQSVNVMSCHDINVVHKDVFINGTRTRLKDGVRSFDAAPRDQMLVKVPRDYRGYLELKVLGNSRFEVSEWQGGSVRMKLEASARAVFSAGRLTELTSFSIKPEGRNPRFNIKANIGFIDSDLIDVHLSNVGRVYLQEIKTNLFKGKTLGAALKVDGFACDYELEDCGNGSVHMEGTFGMVKKLITGPQGAEIQLLSPQNPRLL